MLALHQQHRLHGEKYSQTAASPPSGLHGLNYYAPGQTAKEGPLPGQFIKGAPWGLWVQGQFLPSDRQAVAIVGSRRCTNHGAQDAYELSTELVQAGITIDCVAPSALSGLALGIGTNAKAFDGFAPSRRCYAVRAALKAGGRTIAVLGTGFNCIRPVRHRSLYAEILSSGAGVSPFNPDFKGYRDGHNYLQRNSVISALSRVLVVADAQERSGSLAAARGALRQGRPVGLTLRLVETQAWAQEFLMKPGVFVVNSVSDVLERVVV